MKYDKLEKIMCKFSIEQLKAHLGETLVNSMIEWSVEGEPIFTRINLINAIITIHGINILCDHSFRFDLLSCLETKELELLRTDNCDKKLELSEFIKKTSTKAWKDTAQNRKLLEILNIDCDIFTAPQEDFAFVENVLNEERFYELLDYQFVIKQKILFELNRPVELNRILIHMPTGTGKTKTAMHAITHHINFDLHKKGLVVWIAHTKELLLQAFDTFKSVWSNLGDGEITTYKIWGDKTDKIDNDEINGIAFCGIQKLISIEKNQTELFAKIRNNCRLIVFDEAHKASAINTKNTVNNLMIKKGGMCNRSLIGLTATPGRSTVDSNKNTVLTEMFGNKIISIDTKLMNELNMPKQKALNAPAVTDIISYFQERRILAKINKEELTYPNCLSDQELNAIKTIANSNGYTDFNQKSLEIIGRNKFRNIEIMKKLRMLNEKGIPTIVFACSVEHGKMLSSMLTLENIPNVLVIGEMSSYDRANAIRDFKNRDSKTNIIINYEVLTTGFDSTNIKCVFIARPTQSVVLYSQMIGRGLRGPQMGGNEECMLIDVKDNLESFNENMAFNHFDEYWKG